MLGIFYTLCQVRYTQCTEECYVRYVIVIVHLSVSSRGRERSVSPLSLNCEDTEQMYFK